MSTAILERPAEQHIHAPPQGFISKYVFSLDHKVIAVQYFVTTGLFFVLAGLLAELMRAQLMGPDNHVLSSTAYNEAYSVHGSAMVWLVIIPILTGAFGNFVMPLQIGARDVAFPWLNMLSFWLIPPSGILLFSSFLYGAPQGGWTEYPTYTISPQSPPGTTLWAAAIFLIGVSSTITGINFLVTIVKMRAPGMTWTRMPLFVWATAVTAFLSFIATSALAVATAALFIERVFGVPFYDPTRGGSPVLWQHMFWFYSHPAVYIMVLPAFGIISEVICTFSRRPIFGYKAIAYSSVAIGLLSFMVWAHHMFTSGLASWVLLPFMVITMIVAIPTGVKIFSWVATLWGGRVRYTTSMLFAIGFLITFTFGGITGILLASVPVDIHLHGNYFVTAHLHYVLFGGSVLGIFAGLYYWWPKMTGRLLDERLGKLHFWLVFIGFNVCFLPMHWLGVLGMSRWIYNYPDQPQFGPWNFIASLGGFLLGGSMLIFAWNALRSARKGEIAGPNPWGARTLEWTLPSPPKYYNFDEIPVVLSGPYEYGKPMPYVFPTYKADLSATPSR